MSIIKSDIVDSIQYFFIHSKVPDNFNPIHICLIPKTDNAERVLNFISITLANVQSKIIVKIFVVRLTPIASDIVSP